MLALALIITVSITLILSGLSRHILVFFSYFLFYRFDFMLQKRSLSIALLLVLSFSFLPALVFFEAVCQAAYNVRRNRNYLVFRETPFSQHPIKGPPDQFCGFFHFY